MFIDDDATPKHKNRTRALQHPTGVAVVKRVPRLGRFGSITKLVSRKFKAAKAAKAYLAAVAELSQPPTSRASKPTGSSLLADVSTRVLLVRSY